MNVELIRDRKSLETLAGEWDPLLKSSSADSIFLTWEWISAWIDAVHPDVDLFVVAVRDEQDRLVGVAPFYCFFFYFLKFFRYRYLCVIGDCHSGAEYPDIIVKHGEESRVLDVIAGCIFDNRDLWECLWLPNISGWSGALSRFDSLQERDISFCRTRKASFSNTVLPETMDEYLQSLSGGFRATLNRQAKKICSRQDIEFDVCSSESDIPYFLDNLFVLHRKRWESIGQAGSFVRRPLMKKFYERFAPVALRKGWLGLFALRVEGDVKAVQYGYTYNKSFMQLQEGFDPAAIPGLGNLLRKYVIEWCIENGMVEYDFLGEHTPHKSHWGGKERWGHHFFLGRRCPRNMLLSVKEFWPTGRFIDRGNF